MVGAIAVAVFVGVILVIVLKGYSIAYVRAGTIEVRPVGPGRGRRVEVTPARAVTGGVSFFEGRR